MNKFQMTLSLRMRLTLITSLLLTIMCALFTAFSIYNANNSIQVAVLTEPSYSAEVTPAQQIEPSLFASEEQISLKAAQVSTAAFSQLSIYFMVGAIMMGSLIMYFISGIILKPLQRLSDVISKIDRDALHTRITEFHAGDELNILSDSFNSMLERLDLAFAREKRFSVDAAHELKTPLTVVKTTLEVLEMDAPKIQDENLAEYNEAFAVMKTQTERMNVLVNQLFAFSAMGGTLQRESVRLDQLVRSMQTQVAPLCTKAQITVCEQLEICTISGDKLLLERCVLNLLTNAVKYSENGGLITISVKNQEGNGLVEIRDQGIGIPEKERAHIFEPFYRVDKSRSRAVGGAGLGLAIVKEIVDLHGGELQCFSNEPQGTVFQVLLPMRKD